MVATWWLNTIRFSKNMEYYKILQKYGKQLTQFAEIFLSEI